VEPAKHGGPEQVVLDPSRGNLEAPYQPAHGAHVASIHVTEAQPGDDREHGGVEVVSDLDDHRRGQRGDEVGDGVPLQRREMVEAGGVEGLGSDVAAEGMPERPVRHGVEVIVVFAAVCVGQSDQEARGGAVGEGVGVVDERAVSDGRVNDLLEDNCSRCWSTGGTPATPPDQDGPAQEKSREQDKELRHC
jgi:hypothetical protein